MSPTTSPRTTTQVMLVSKSKNEMLLEKYFDAFEFDFDYEKSGIWSPPVRRTAFLGSPERVFTEEELMDKLRNALESRKVKGCVNVWGCISSLFSSFQKRVKKRKEITFGR
ncbi:hypothetical protein RND81_07G154800 [Saponaria officinalis]|uniref:Uncharacterized protein n=1 Tax=Saponaria officinalis TaxID=3572 RepID=A0AAW1JNQ7_SAPOF